MRLIRAESALAQSVDLACPQHARLACDLGNARTLSKIIRPAETKPFFCMMALP